MHFFSNDKILEVISSPLNTISTESKATMNELEPSLRNHAEHNKTNEGLISEVCKESQNNCPNSDAGNNQIVNSKLDATRQ